MPSLALAFQVIRELGLRPVMLYALYHVGLRSGHFRRVLRGSQAFDAMPEQVFSLQPILELPDRNELVQVMGTAAQADLLAQAEEIVAGRVRLFGGQARRLNLVPPGELQHWTAYELGKVRVDAPHGDIKFIWEPCRFGWAIILGRAYHLTQDERFASAFWTNFETFTQHNPPFDGPNWVSAQEVALRLVALAFAGQVLAASENSTAPRMLQLGQAIACHAGRIPPTLVYARAQNNNHLLSEAAGLFTASLLLPHHPQAARWRKLGWKWFQRGIQKQVTPHGVFMQHSANYHRLMLQLALWMDALCRKQGLLLAELPRERLAAATRWSLALLDPVSGRTPNLGANDGASILPLTTLPFEDYRPVAQAAGAAFLKESPLPAGAWDEMRLWFGLKAETVGKPLSEEQSLKIETLTQALGVIRHPQKPQSWAYLRLAEFHDRPGHADLLHVDLWQEGVNLALDAGTYLYNAESPWDNALTRTQVHNTIVVDGQEQMRRVGRFLYLDWAQTQVISSELDQDGRLKKLSAQHNGYIRSGVIHQRMVSALDDGDWLVEDHLLEGQNTQGQGVAQHTLTLHWLLPDWPWWLENRIDGVDVYLDASQGRIQLSLAVETGRQPNGPLQVQVVRAGELLEGEGSVSPTWGWNSPRYGDKIPALAVRCSVISQLPVKFTSHWKFNKA